MIVEDGTGLPAANSYCDVDFADEYLLLDPKKADWAILIDDTKEALLILGSEALDLQFIWNGIKTYANSGLRFPRTGIFGRDGQEFPGDEIPTNIKKATAEMAYFINTNNPMPFATGAGISRLRVDVIDIRFDSSTRTHPFPPKVLALAGEFGVPPKYSRVNQIAAI
jgi:hypothetical protein